MLVALIFTVWFMNNLAINFYNKHALPLEPTPPQTATGSVCGLRTLLVVPWGFRLAHGVGSNGRWLLGKTDFSFPMTYTTTNKTIGWFASLTVMSISVCTGKGSFPPPAKLRAQFLRPMIHIHGVLTVSPPAWLAPRPRVPFGQGLGETQHAGRCTGRIWSFAHASPWCVQACNIGFNNWSLVFISLSINQLLRSAVPLPTAVLSTVFEKKTFNWQVWASMAVVCVGAMLASAGSGDATTAGILICLGSVLSGAAWTVVSGMLLQMGEEPLDSLSVLFCSSPTCIVTT